MSFKKLSMREKVEYVWDYYKLHIIAGVCGIVILVNTIYNAVTYKEPLLSVIMLNSYSSMTDTTNSGFEEFFELYDYETFDGVLELNKDLYLYGMDNTIYEDYQNYEALLALLLAGDYEVFIGTGEVYLEFTNQGYFADLSEILPQELFVKYEKQMMYSDDMGETEAYPSAVLLNRNQWLTQNGYYEEECYFGILKKSNTPDVAADFAEFLLTYSGGDES